MEIGGVYSPADMQDCQKSLAEFAADAENSVQIVFGRGLYVDKTLLRLQVWNLSAC